MADLSNKCYKLISLLPEVKEKYKLEELNLEEKMNLIFNTQKNLQIYIHKNQNLYELSKENLIKSDLLFDFVINQWIAIQDEFQELLEAIGGEKYKSASWKWWKKDNKEFLDQNLKIILSEEEKEELKFEVIDLLHFYLNFAVLSSIISGKNPKFYITISQKENRKEPFDVKGSEVITYLKEFLFNKIKLFSISSLQLRSLKRQEVLSDIDIFFLTSGLEIFVNRLLEYLITLWTDILNLDLNDFFYYYLVKNFENINRQDRGY